MNSPVQVIFKFFKSLLVRKGSFPIERDVRLLTWVVFERTVWERRSPVKDNGYPQGPKGKAMVRLLKVG
jgi:hypothetical protein